MTIIALPDWVFWSLIWISIIEFIFICVLLKDLIERNNEEQLKKSGKYKPKLLVKEKDKPK